jgi:integrase
MNKLETGIAIVLQRLKSELAAATWESRRQYYNQMLQLAHTLGINEACQKLYDAYIADDNGFKNRRKMHIHCVKLLDAIEGTNARDEHGKLYNEQSLPGKEETEKYFHSRQYPPADKVSIDHLIVKAEIEMRYLNLSESTIGQYRHAWMDILRYFNRHNSPDYDEQLLQCFIREIGSHRDEGSMKQWKWKINRKAANVLIEVANTGQFHWGLIKPGITCAGMEIENIRNLYLSLLKSRNLSKSTINLHDYVFRKLVSFLKIDTANDLFLLSPKSVQGVIINLAGICNKRSMATILPVLRSLLASLFTLGYAEKDVSGIVMSGYVQKGSVAGYLSQKDQAAILEQINKESKRTKAIILLAVKLGLRGCDISNLTFQELDWRNDKITLLQKKTGTPLVLPLLADVGNALMEYILYERPKRKDRYPYVFLRKQAPYNKITSAYSTCSKLLMKLGIKPVNSQAKGAHVFRYTMVHRLLAVKTPHQVITNTLGHVSKESDKPYLSMEESMLRLCALDLSVVGTVSWEGGI